MSIICPTVLADTSDEYKEQMDTVSRLASRIQIDLGDGQFTAATVAVADVWWPDHLSPDIHLMHQQPSEAVRALAAKQPHMIIVHAEADELTRLIETMTFIQQQGIAAGIALLQATSVDGVRALVEQADHVLIFSGSLGSFGGTADLSLLGKAAQVRAVNPSAEIGWDGGANLANVSLLARGGIDVINVGGAIQKANHPANAFLALQRRIED